MFSLRREWGNSMCGSRARPPLRRRVNISEIGSVIFCDIILPTGLYDAGNQSIQRPLAERQAGNPKLAEVSMTASAHRATIHQARWAGVAGQFLQAGVIALRFQLSTESGVLLHRLRFA